MRRDTSKDTAHMDVQSSSVQRIGYHPESGDLHVTFNDTGRYVYHGVPKELHEALMMAGSKGNFLHSNIKGRYNFTKL